MTTDPFVGMMLGSYKVIEPIGEGGMARIYKGYHVELKRYAAIKVINWGLQEDPAFTERFRREAQAIASLRHPNIVQIFDFGKHDTGYFMVMEFIEGHDLSVELRQVRESNELLLPKEKIFRIIKDAAAALDYAHQREVVHRDVKPSNIMIHKEGQAILTDFGLVMLPTHKSQATIGSTFGTPHYVAPEQAISSAAAVAASDIYSLGVILYEMATGQLPFDDESPLSVALKHISNLPTPPSAINPALPLAVEEVILKALNKQPVDRFASAGDMAASLAAAWSGDMALEGGSRSKPLSPVLPAGVPSVTDVPSITLPNAAAVAPVAASPEPASAQKIAPPASGSKQTRPRWWSWAAAAVLVALVIPTSFLFFNNFSSAQPTVIPTTGTTAAAIAIITETATAGPTSTPTVAAMPTVAPALPSATPTPEPTATPQPTDTPTPTSVLPTATPAPTATPTATFTPVPLLPTATPTTGVLTRDQLRGKILFKTDRSGTVEIYQMETDGSNQRPIPRENWSLYTELEAALPFSPDRTQPIIIRGAGQLDLWWSNLITSQELRVTSTGSPEYDAAWSPVDNRIAYVSEETGNGDIYVLNLDGSAVVRLTENLDDFDKHPTWSPDGTKIAFWSDRGFNKTRQVWVIDLATKTTTSLSDNPFNDWDPVWVW